MLDHGQKYSFQDEKSASYLIVVKIRGVKREIPHLGSLPESIKRINERLIERYSRNCMTQKYKEKYSKSKVPRPHLITSYFFFFVELYSGIDPFERAGVCSCNFMSLCTIMENIDED